MPRRVAKEKVRLLVGDERLEGDGCLREFTKDLLVEGDQLDAEVLCHCHEFAWLNRINSSTKQTESEIRISRWARDQMISTRNL